MKRIGILGGSSDQATADYYRRLNQMSDVRAGNYLAERAKGLEQVGAELLLCVSNTLHRTAPIFTAGLSIPFLHIVDPTAAAILARGLTRGLLGTKPVMATDFLIRRYSEKFGIETLVPAPDVQDLVDR